MNYLIKGLILVIALLHSYFLYFEMFAWETKGPKIFKNFPKTIFKPTVSMAANQGLYNGFLAAGLLWSLTITNLEWQQNVALFFLTCISIAGIYGAFTVSKKIVIIQSIPALITIGLILIS